MDDRKKLRLWPAAIILLGGAIALGVIWSLPSSHQERNIRALVALFVAFAALLAWFVLGSRAPRAARFVTIGAVLILIFASRQFLVIRGVTGDLIPIIEFRSKSRAALPVSKAASPAPQLITNSI